jgi:hypothetical protein
MRRPAWVAVLVIALLLVSAVPNLAWSQGRHSHSGVRTHLFVGVGPGFWWGPSYPYWHYPPPYYGYYPGYYSPPYYGYSPPPVVMSEPQAYTQQQPAQAEAYWYYCSSSQAYYPYAQSCPEAWVKVSPRPQ